MQGEDNIIQAVIWKDHMFYPAKVNNETIERVLHQSILTQAVNRHIKYFANSYIFSMNNSQITTRKPATSHQNLPTIVFYYYILCKSNMYIIHAQQFFVNDERCACCVQYFLSITGKISKSSLPREKKRYIIALMLDKMHFKDLQCVVLCD